MPKHPLAADAVALPDEDRVRFKMIQAYAEWLDNERNVLCHLMGWDSRLVVFTGARDFHFGEDAATIMPMERATSIMSFAGVNMDRLRECAEAEVREEDGVEVQP